MYRVLLKTMEPHEDWQAPSKGDLYLQRIPEEAHGEIIRKARESARFVYAFYYRNIVGQPGPGEDTMSWAEMDTCADIIKKIRECQAAKAEFIELTNDQYDMLKRKINARLPEVADERLSELRRDLDAAEKFEPVVNNDNGEVAAG